MEDIRIKIIAEAETKEGEAAIKRMLDNEKELKEEVQKAGEAVKKKESEYRNLNDTGGKTNSIFSNLGKTMIALFAADKLIDYTKQLVTLMSDTDRYQMALKNVSKTTTEYENSIGFLNTTANKYGQSVNALTQSYTSFIASSNSTNLSIKERQNIYESIIKAGSALKLSNDGIQGSLTAVAQMFSKGNVSAEELRGQLGERLPGAFGIMAKALGVNEKQLNKMLEQGEVLAEEALPKFAKALEEVYGDKAQSNLKTIGGAWNVLTNNLIEGLQDFNKSSLFIETISGWILAASVQLKNFISFVKDAFTIGTEYNKVLNKWYDYYEVLFNAIGNIVGAGWNLIKSLAQITSNILGTGDATLTFKKIVDYLIIGVKTLGSVLIGAVTVVQVLADSFNIALNAGKRFANFFGADFKIDPKATFSNLANNAETNFKRITDLWQNSSKAVLGTAKNTNKSIIDDEKDKTNQLEKELNKQVGDTKKAEKEKEDAIKRTQKESEKAHKDTIKAIEKANDEADKNIRKSLENYVKAKITSNKAELDANEKLQKELMDNALKMASLKDSLEKLEKIKKAKTLEEIEKIESEYSDKALKRELDYSKIWLQRKEKEFKELKELGALTKEEEDKRAKELLELRQTVADKELAITKKVVNDKQKQLKDDKDFVDNLWKQEEEEYKKKQETKLDNEKKYEDRKKEIIKQSIDAAYGLSMIFFDKQDKLLSDQLNKAETHVEKFNIESQKSFNDVGKNLASMAANLASGNFAGAIGNALTFVGQFIKSFNADVELAKAKMEDLYDSMKKNSDNMAALFDDIKNIYGDNTTVKIPDWVKEISNSLGEMYTQNTIELEIKKGQSIIDNYALATDKENQYTDLVKKGIEDTFNREVANINAKYDLLAIKNAQRFDSESIGIQKGVNTSLLAFIQSEELKTGLTSEYESRRNKIKETFALAYTPLTEGMSQSEIDGINAAIKARDEAFSKLEEWQTTQLQFTIDNGKLQIDTFTEVERIIQKGKDDTYQLGLQYQAKEIEDKANRDKEIEAAQIKLNSNLEIESKRHNDTLRKLGEDKDAALMESFTRLKEMVNAGYEEMIANATRLYNQGIITASQFEELINRANTLRNLVNPNNWPTTTPTTNPSPDNNPYIIDIPIPRFNTGTEKVGGNPGIDKNLALLSYDEGVMKGSLNTKRLDAGLNMAKTVEYAINYKNMMSDSSFVPLELKPNLMQKLDERMAMQYLLNMNMQPVIEELQAVKMVIKNMPQTEFKITDGEISKVVRKGNSVQVFKSNMFD